MAFLRFAQHFQQRIGAIGKADMIDIMFVIVIVAVLIVMDINVVLDGLAGFVKAGGVNEFFQHDDCVGRFISSDDADFGIFMQQVENTFCMHFVHGYVGSAFGFECQ